MNAITIFRGGAIGDFVLTLPAINAVRRAFPTADLRLIGRPATLALGPAASVLDGEDPRLIPLHRAGPLLPATRQLFAATHRVLAYAVDAQQHFGPQLRRAVAGPVLLWDPRPPADFRGHIIDHLLSPLRQWGLPVCDRTPHIELRLGDYAYVDSLAAAPEVVIHLGSGSPAKCWPTANFHALASALQKKGWHTALLCGPVERERQLTTGDLPALHPPDLRSLAGLLAKAALFIGNDSGPGHIAAAVGTPTLTL
ncbi:MAG: glycosyltransferase family 9 protein, partial [Gemmatimonadota bacterium]|nr:glycosyltransferase family 9 protein [Gemmatimonadota bacterium]